MEWNRDESGTSRTWNNGFFCTVFAETNAKGRVTNYVWSVLDKRGICVKEGTAPTLYEAKLACRLATS